MAHREHCPSPHSRSHSPWAVLEVDLFPIVPSISHKYSFKNSFWVFHTHWVCHSVQVEVSEQLSRVSSCLLPWEAGHLLSLPAHSRNAGITYLAFVGSRDHTKVVMLSTKPLFSMIPNYFNYFKRVNRKSNLWHWLLKQTNKQINKYILKSCPKSKR